MLTPDDSTRKSRRESLWMSVSYLSWPQIRSYCSEDRGYYTSLSWVISSGPLKGLTIIPSERVIDPNLRV